MSGAPHSSGNQTGAPAKVTFPTIDIPDDAWRVKRGYPMFSFSLPTARGYLKVEAAFASKNRDLYQFIEEDCEVKLHSLDDGHPDGDDEWVEGESLTWTASVRFKKRLLPAFEKLIRQELASRRANPSQMEA